MSILRKLLGNDVVVSEPTTPEAQATSVTAPAVSKETLLRAELAGADAARLTALALEDKRSAMRFLAAEALGALPTPKETWESIAQTWADKDRRLSRLAREHLAAFAHQADLEARTQALTGEFAGLLDKPAIDLTRLIELDAVYDQLKADALKAAPTKGFEALAEVRNEVGTRLEAGQDAQRQLIDIERQADAARLALVAQQSVVDPLLHAALAERFEALDTTAVPAVIVDRTHKALTSLESLVQSAIARGAAELTCREILARIDVLDPADTAARHQLEEDILAAGLPQDLLVRTKDAYDLRTGGVDAEQRRLEQEARTTARATEKAARGAESRAAAEAMLALITETEAHLAAGEAKAALKAAPAIKRHRADAERLAPDLRARFHAIETEVLKLEGFSRDLARTRRAELMERARKLPELTLNIEMLRTAVQTLQNEWKALDAEAGGAPRKLWDEFHTATNKAYETVKLYRAMKAEERGEHMKAKEAALADIEALAAAATVEQPEWNKIASRRGELVRKWYDLGGIGRKEQKTLQGRMEAALKIVDARLDAERATERARRQALISQVEAARARAEAERPAEPDANDRPWPALADAMKVAQDCQKQWNVRVSPLMLPRKEEQALWDTFRALGNTVFEMRSQAREAVKARQGAERAQQQTLIDQMRTLSGEADRQLLQTKLVELQKAWRTLSVRPERGAERQFDDAAQAVKNQLNALKRQDERGVWDALLDLDAALAEAERQPGSADLADKLAGIEAKLDPKHAAHAGIMARKAGVLGGKPVASKTQRADALIDLELALSIPARPGEESMRRARQMVLLSRTLKDRGARTEPREMLLDLIALPGITERARLGAIIDKL